MTLFFEQNGFNATVNGQNVLVESTLSTTMVDFDHSLKRYFLHNDYQKYNKLTFVSRKMLHKFLSAYEIALAKERECYPLDELQLIIVDGVGYVLHLDNCRVYDLVELYDPNNFREKLGTFNPAGEGWEPECKYKQSGVDAQESFFQRLAYVDDSLRMLLERNNIEFVEWAGWNDLLEKIENIPYEHKIEILCNHRIYLDNAVNLKKWNDFRSIVEHAFFEFFKDREFDKVKF